MILQGDFPYLRWLLLKLLADEGGGYWAGDGSLSRGLDQLGFGATVDQVRVALAWLHGVEAIDLKKDGSTISGRITQSGLDVVEGRQVSPGIKRPLHMDVE